MKKDKKRSGKEEKLKSWKKIQEKQHPKTTMDEKFNKRKKKKRMNENEIKGKKKNEKARCKQKCGKRKKAKD